MSRVSDPPKRPSLPVTFPVLVGVLGGEWLVLRLAWTLPMAAVVGAASLFAGAVVTWRGHAVGTVGIVAAVALLVGALAGSVASWSLGRFSESIGETPVSGWSLEVCGDPSLGERGYRCRARATRAGMPSGSVWLSCDEEPMLGDTLTCVGRFRPNGDDEWGTSNRAQGIAGTVKVVRVRQRREARGPYGAILRLRTRAVEAMGASGSESGALVAASVCGYRAGMDAFGLTDLFSACGVSHLVAVSGGHLAIVSGVLSTLLEALGLRPRVRSTVLIAVGGTFVVFCGAPVSAVRSWLMVIVAAGSEFAGRRGHALSAVCLVGTGMALVDPFVSGQLGFLLSVASVVGLAVLTPYLSYVLRVTFPTRLPRFLLRSRLGRRAADGISSLRDTLAATLVAQAVTSPVTVPTFGELSVVAPLSNVLLGPLFGITIAAGMLVVPLCALPGPAGSLAIASLLPARLSARVSIATLRPLARLPLATLQVTGNALPTALVCLIVLVYLAWPSVRRCHLLGGAGVASAFLTVILLRWRLFAPARVVVLDVGQGDAILVQDGRSAVLVDTGPDASAAAALARKHVLHLDAVLLTHLHDDHVGGLDDLVGSVPCGRVLVARGACPSLTDDLRVAVADLTGGEAQEVSYGDTLAVGGFSLRVVSPTGEVSGNENEDSVELLLTYGQDGGATLTALLTGDAEREVTGETIGRGDVGDIDLLKVGHHGSAVSITPEEAGLLKPEVSVASAGEGNRYGHPTEECVETLEATGSRFLCTKDVGDVDVRPGRNGPIVRYDGPRER